MAIKRLGEGEKDQPSTHKELFLFFQEMDEWEILDQRLVCAMQEIHAEPLGSRKTTSWKWLLRICLSLLPCRMVLRIAHGMHLGASGVLSTTGTKTTRATKRE
jgi:hypothetical protein